MKHSNRSTTLDLLLKLLVIIFIAVAGITVVVAKDALFGPTGVFANPNKCAPGQEKREGCKWVQHSVTGKCQWLPADAVANPWEEVPEGTCPVLPVPSATATTIIIYPTNTLIPTCTATLVPTVPAVPTASPGLPSATPNDKKSDPTVDPGKPSSNQPQPTITATLPCDTCRAAQQQADALSTMAAAQVTRNAWEMRP